MAVEFAIVLPLLLTLLLGLMEIGRLVEVSQILDNAARESGRQASTGQRSTAEVRDAALDSLRFAGIETDGVVVTLENLTEPSRADPSRAEQLDRIAIKVSLPIDNLDWMALDRGKWVAGNTRRVLPATQPLAIARRRRKLLTDAIRRNAFERFTIARRGSPAPGSLVGQASACLPTLRQAEAHRFEHLANTKILEKPRTYVDQILQFSGSESWPCMNIRSHVPIDCESGRDG